MVFKLIPIKFLKEIHPTCLRMKFCTVSVKVVLQGVGPCFKNMTSDLRSHKITGSTSGTVTVTSLKTSGKQYSCWRRAWQEEQLRFDVAKNIKRRLGRWLPPEFLGETGRVYQLLCSP